MQLSRRQLIIGGCGAAVAMSLPRAAHGRPSDTLAPRVACSHTGCRHHRPSDKHELGVCALAARSDTQMETP